MSFNLIVPIAADKPEYETSMPYLFNLGDDGTMLCIKAVTGLELSMFDVIYFVLLAKHFRRYALAEMFDIQLRRLGMDNARVVQLDSPTRCQAETVALTLRQLGLRGSIFIKDADNYFECEVIRQNGIAIYPLEAMPIVNPQNKSYVAVDDMYCITNIIENRIVSRYFNAGGVCFGSADEYLHYFDALSRCEGHLRVSHIVYAMLLDRHLFRPFAAESFADWGDPMSYRLNRMTVR